MNKIIREIGIEEFLNIVASKSYADNSKRKIIGICGIPGSGKSTIAQYVVAKLNQVHDRRVFGYLPMDGFHMSNHKLEDLGLGHKKGTIETFEIEAFLSVLQAVKFGHIVKCPIYSRAIHDVVENAICIDEQSVVITEGNYLLSKHRPWNQVSTYLDFCFFLYEEREVVRDRLFARQKSKSLSDEEANRHVDLVDMKNYEYIASLLKYADFAFKLKHYDAFT